jgi:putative CocE/NonD family hydrolase
MYSKALDPEIMRTMLPPDFPADKLSRPQYKMVAEKDVMIPMRDGVMIAANIYRPDAPGTFPALHAADSYQKDMVDIVPTLPIFHCVEVNDIEYFVSRGYVFVHTDSRGTGHSPEGEWAFWSQEEQTDLYDMIEWIAVQDWCTGKVGMLGESLLAWVQWFAACQQPPHLTCVLPWDAGADMYRDVAWHGGVMAVGFPTAWHMWEIRGHYRLGIPARFDTAPANPDSGRWDLVWNVINHPTYDDFWRLRNPDFAKIQVPVFTVGALHKVGLHLRGVVRGYEEVKTPKKMMLIHGVMDGDEMAIYNSPEMRLLMLRWYDHWLKDNDTGFMDEPPVSIYVRGADAYRSEADWPIPRTEYRKLFFHSGPSTSSHESLNDGRLSWEPPAETDSSFTYAYPDEDWTHFSGGGTAPIEDGIVHFTRRIPTFVSEPLEDDLEVSGNIVLVLYASSDQTNTDFFCRLVDQLPDEQQASGLPPRGYILTRGWLKASHAATKSEALSKPYRPYYLHDEPRQIEPNKAHRFEIEVWPTCNLFKKGHRIRVDVACGDSPAVDFGGHYYGVKVGSDTYYHDTDHPSHIVLPVIPSA